MSQEIGLPDAITRADNLPSPPTVAMDVLRIANDEDASIQDLTAVLSRDPALSAKLLKLANSSMFRRGDEVTALDAAAMRLGMKTVKLMALSFSLTDELPRKSDTRGFDYPDYWRRSLTMAVAGRSLGRLVGSPNGEEAFLCGLLGRIGQLVMARSLGQEYAAIIDRAEGELPSAAEERDALGYDSHRVGAAVLEAWELPQLISEAVRHWGNPEAAPEQASDLPKILHLADVTTSVICGSRKGSSLRTLHERGAVLFGVSEDEVDAFILSLEQDVADMAAMLNVDVAADSYAEIVDRARMEMVQISLGTAMDLQQQSTRAEELEKQNRELADLASTDKLTGIPNRGHFDQVLERVVAARLSGSSEDALGVLLLDVDHFKRFNDTHGHQVGDEVLKVVAGCLTEATRDTDLAARYGGEEFVVILAHSDRVLLEKVAERIRERIARASLEHDGETLSVTVSVGGACVSRVRAAGDGSALVALADACLYQAKDAGRNCCVCREVETIASAG